MRIATINIEPISPLDKLDPEDAQLSKSYQVALNDSVTPEQIADTALDVFHDNVAVNNLDDFAFTVTFNGDIVEPNPKHDSYSFNQMGHML